jgi:hypothetical protein
MKTNRLTSGQIYAYKERIFLSCNKDWFYQSWSCYLLFLTILPESICCHICPRRQSTALLPFDKALWDLLIHCFCALTSFRASSTWGLLCLAAIHAHVAQSIWQQVVRNSSLQTALLSSRGWRVALCFIIPLRLLQHWQNTSLSPDALFLAILSHGTLSPKYYLLWDAFAGLSTHPSSLQQLLDLIDLRT